jgi:predicted TIM-barrel fold metal-dependent hydrolase
MAGSSTTTANRYTIVSADCHAGGSHDQYRGYLEARYFDDFDAWRTRYDNPFRDLLSEKRTRNWDDEVRTRDLEADGIVAEVVFPNTVPPFFPTGQIVAPAPRADDFEHRLAGLRAHNRWLSDFCAARPGRRAGLAQILLNDVDEAVADVRWAKAHGLAGILLPGVAPDTPWIEPLFSARYDPLWAACQDLELPITHHSGGSGIPSYGRHPSAVLMFVMETGFFANRALWHLTMSGVFQRFPGLTFVMTEQGSSWLPAVLAQMDDLHRQTLDGRIGELAIAPEIVLPRPPSDYFRTNCYLAASFPAPQDALVLEQIGVERVMWGSDYPHHEATTPYTRESLRRSFSGWRPAVLQRVLAGTAAEVYGFDLTELAPIAERCGPTVDEIAAPLDHVPSDATSPAFFKP